MTATQEINILVKQHRKLRTDTEREAFYQDVISGLTNKDSDGLAEGLLALKESVRNRRLKAEREAQSKKGAHFQVFTASEEERELLKLLLERLNIPFKMSA
jgi:hypothetical protein